MLELRSKVPGVAARAHLAHVQNSDAHSLLAFANAPKKRALTRIKMDPLSFEGFRTALADPQARVRAEIQLPPSVPRVIGLHVEGGFLHSETYRIDETNRAIKAHEADLDAVLRAAAKTIDGELSALAAVHKQIEQKALQQVADLQKAGLSASLAEHNKVVTRRGVLAREIALLAEATSLSV